MTALCFVFWPFALVQTRKLEASIAKYLANFLYYTAIIQAMKMAFGEDLRFVITSNLA